MTVFYHVTPLKNLKSILRKGLSPGKARGLSELLYSNGEILREEKSSLYFVSSLGDMGSLLDSVSYQGSSSNYALLEVDIPTEADLDIESGGATAPFYKYKGRIPASSIRYLGNVTPGSLPISGGALPVHSLSLSSREEEKALLAGQRRSWSEIIRKGIESVMDDLEDEDDEEFHAMSEEADNLEAGLSRLDSLVASPDWEDAAVVFKTSMDDFDSKYGIDWFDLAIEESRERIGF